MSLMLPCALTGGCFYYNVQHTPTFTSRLKQGRCPPCRALYSSTLILLVQNQSQKKGEAARRARAANIHSGWFATFLSVYCVHVQAYAREGRGQPVAPRLELVRSGCPPAESSHLLQMQVIELFFLLKRKIGPGGPSFHPRIQEAEVGRVLRIQG